MAKQNGEQQRKPDRSAREVILGDCMATLLFMAASSVFDEVPAPLCQLSQVDNLSRDSSDCFALNSLRYCWPLPAGCHFKPRAWLFL